MLLCGAGASGYLGLPTLDDILERSILANDEVAQRIRAIKNAIETNRFGRAAFEELIVKLRSYLDITQLIRTDSLYRNEFGQIPHSVFNGEVERKWKEALIKCYRILLEEYGPKKILHESRAFSTMLQLLEELTKLNSGKLHIYTTNYDCSYQVLSSHARNLTFYTHISPGKGEFSERWYRANPFVENADCPSVYLHRLHGCIAWFNDGQEAGSLIREIWGAGEDLEIVDDNYLHKMCIKLIASQLIGSNPAFSLAFEEFARHLNEVQTLLIWGYSFRDLEVLRLINHAYANRKKPLSIVYIDPYLRETAARENIQRTLLNAPIHQVDKNFQPKQIDWKPTDGHDMLVETVIKSVKNANHGKKEKRRIG